MEIPKELEEDIFMYSLGIVHISVCVPEGMDRQVVEDRANARNPTGIDSGWKISKDSHFRTGEPNPCPCTEAKGRLHYLLSC